MADAVAVFTPGQRLVDTEGAPFASCEVNFYEAGTSTPKLVYADAELTTELGTTVYTDSAGYPVTSSGSTTKTLVYTNTDPYKIQIVANAVTIAEHDNVKGAVVASGTPGGSFLTQDAADVRYVRNPNALSTVTTLTTGDKIPVFIASAAGNRAITWPDLTADLLGEWRTAGYIFSAGARILFQQTTPPTGWTKETNSSYNDAILAFTTGSVSTSGAVALSSLFASQTFTGTVGNDTPSISKTAAHTHPVTAANSGTPVAFGGSGNNLNMDSGSNSVGTTLTATSTGSGTAHNHSLTMDAFNMSVKRVGTVIGQKS
jgi:hypothetical protein